MSQKVLREFSATLDELYPMLDFVGSFARQMTDSQEELNFVRLIAEEALVNIIRYAYSTGSGSIGIECERSGYTLKIHFIDDGIPFDPIQEANRFDLKAHERLNNPGGYGTFLILKLSDAVTYRREERSNILTITKSFKPADE